ncbi:oligopeptidase a, partial [Nannochloropsis oceanica]
MRPAALATAAAALGGMGLLGGVSGGSSSGNNGHAGLTTMSAAAATATPAGVGGGNALLEQEGLPKFAKIAPEAVVPAIRQLSQDFMTQFSQLEEECSKGGAASFEAVVETMEKARGPLEYGWGVVNHLLGVKNSDALREAHQTVQPEVVAMLTQIGQ